MKFVCELGYTPEKLFVADICPTRLPPDFVGNPFEYIPEFENVFLDRHLENFLSCGGEILLVGGNITFEILVAVKEDLIRLPTINEYLRGTNGNHRRHVS